MKIDSGSGDTVKSQQSSIRRCCRIMENYLRHMKSILNVHEQRGDQAAYSVADQEFAQAIKDLQPQLLERRLQLSRASLDRANHKYSIFFRVGRDGHETPS
jgi:hypothetical protein